MVDIYGGSFSNLTVTSPIWLPFASRAECFCIISLEFSERFGKVAIALVYYHARILCLKSLIYTKQNSIEVLSYNVCAINSTEGCSLVQRVYILFYLDFSLFYVCIHVPNNILHKVIPCVYNIHYKFFSFLDFSRFHTCTYVQNNILHETIYGVCNIHYSLLHVEVKSNR